MPTALERFREIQQRANEFIRGSQPQTNPAVTPRNILSGAGPGVPGSMSKPPTTKQLLQGAGPGVKPSPTPTTKGISGATKATPTPKGTGFAQKAVKGLGLLNRGLGAYQTVAPGSTPAQRALGAVQTVNPMLGFTLNVGKAAGEAYSRMDQTPAVSGRGAGRATFNPESRLPIPEAAPTGPKVLPGSSVEELRAEMAAAMQRYPAASQAPTTQDPAPVAPDPAPTGRDSAPPTPNPNGIPQSGTQMGMSAGVEPLTLAKFQAEIGNPNNIQVKDPFSSQALPGTSNAKGQLELTASEIFEDGAQNADYQPFTDEQTQSTLGYGKTYGDMSQFGRNPKGASADSIAKQFETKDQSSLVSQSDDVDDPAMKYVSPISDERRRARAAFLDADNSLVGLRRAEGEMGIVAQGEKKFMRQGDDLVEITKDGYNARMSGEEASQNFLNQYMAKKSQELNEIVPESPAQDQNPIELQESAESGGSDKPDMTMLYNGEPELSGFDKSKFKIKPF